MAITKAKNQIDECLDNSGLRLFDKRFVRQRRLGAKRLLQMILHRVYKALQLACDDYFNLIDELPISKQAFSQARKYLNPEYVRSFVDMTAEIAAQDTEAPNYLGMRLIAIDGSSVALENTLELKEAYGCSGSKKDAATALCSIAYSPLDHVVYDCQLKRYGTDERDLAKQHIERLNELGLNKCLLLFDRWYPSAEFIAFLHNHGHHFVMRVRGKWNLEADSINTQGWISIIHEGKAYDVRVLKITLPSGEVETLLTSLHQKQLPIRNAGALYFERWKVETAYDLIKSKLQLENFSGKTKISVLQDFYATMFLANITAFADEEADSRIADADSGKELKYKRKANRNYTIAKLRDVFLCLIMEPDETLRDAMLESLVIAISKHPVPIVPGRSPARKTPRKKRFHMARKVVV